VGCCEHGDEPSGSAEEVLALERGLLSMKLVGLFFVSLLVCLFVCQSDSCDLRPLSREVNENCNLKNYPASGGNCNLKSLPSKWR